jgi:hypothetical protein
MKSRNRKSKKGRRGKYRTRKIRGGLHGNGGFLLNGMEKFGQMIRPNPQNSATVGTEIYKGPEWSTIQGAFNMYDNRVEKINKFQAQYKQCPEPDPERLKSTEVINGTKTLHYYPSELEITSPESYGLKYKEIVYVNEPNSEPNSKKKSSGLTMFQKMTKKATSMFERTNPDRVVYYRADKGPGRPYKNIDHTISYIGNKRIIDFSDKSPYDVGKDEVGKEYPVGEKYPKCIDVQKKNSQKASSNNNLVNQNP